MERSGPAGAAAAIGMAGAIGPEAIDGMAGALDLGADSPGAIGRALRGGIGRGAASSSFWRAAISAIAKSSDAGLSGGEGR